MVAVNQHSTFESRYGDPVTNPFDQTEDDTGEAYRVVCAESRVEDSPPKVKDLEDEILMDGVAPKERW
jgi:hypothetical protein